MTSNPSTRLAVAVAAFLLAGLACDAGAPAPTIRPRTRTDSIPPAAVKMSPQTDPQPPQLRVEGWAAPMPLPAPVNTAGAEDGPFITSDGQRLFFTFTPDPGVPPERQLLDGVTGTYVSSRQGDGWGEAERVVLEDAGEPALDGCPFLLGNALWFCSARKGNLRGVDLWTAQFRNGLWTDWSSAGARLNGELQAGEMHLSADGATLYFHADLPGGAGGLDLWMTHRIEGGWSEPENLAAVNSPADDTRPALSPDEAQLWFTRTVDAAPGVFRSVWSDAGWGVPELVLWPFAGEPSLDSAGNLYFAHHFVIDGRIVDADIYVALKN